MCNDDQPVRLLQIRCHLGQELIWRQSGGDGQLQVFANPAFYFPGNIKRRSKNQLHTGKIEKRLVQRQRFNERRIVGQNRHDLRRNRSILIMVTGNENSLRTLPTGCFHRHRRLHAKFPRFIRRSRHNAAPTDSAYDERLAAILRMIALLDRSVKGIHIHMQYPTRHIAALRRLIQPTFRY